MKLITNEESRELAQAALMPIIGTMSALARVTIGVAQVAINLFLLIGSLAATVFVGKEHKYHIYNTGKELGKDLIDGFKHILVGAVVESWWLPVVVMACCEPADGDWERRDAKYYTA